MTRAIAGEPALVSVQTAPGRFEIAAVDPSVAHRVAAAAEEAWRLLAAPLALPEAFSSPVFVRVVSEGESRSPAPFNVIVEPGGVVSLRLPLAGGLITTVAQRGIVQALLMRMAVTRHGVNERLQAPLWLEHACVGWWQTRAEAAQLDALRHESRQFTPPPLTALLEWRRGEAEPRRLTVGAIWLLGFLQTDSGRAREWPALLHRLLGGDEPLIALEAAFPGRFADAAGRELWWATGCHHVRRARTLPALESADSRAQLAALARFVFSGPGDDADRVVPLREVVAHGAEAIVAAELARRALEADRLAAGLHPFYRNAGLALAEVLRSADKNAAKRETLVAAFEQDWRDAIDLEAAAAAALDAWEGRARR